MKEIRLESILTHYESVEELSTKHQELIHLAYEHIKHAYAPFSKYPVAAVVELENGQTVVGTNQENASFPAGICAERVALSTMSSTYPGVKPKTLVVVVQHPNFKSAQAAGPCGICRQTINEYESRFDTEIELIFPAENGGFYQCKSIKTLLPLSFNAKNLMT